MFSDISRYKDLADVIAVDARGRSLKSKAIREIPDVDGDFSHTVEEKDRLDHLASQYYGESGKWWRVCDANPGFKSPPALLGKEPVITTRFAVTFTGTGQTDQPPWYKLLKRLKSTSGVQNVRFRKLAEVVSDRVQYQGNSVEIRTETFSTFITVVYNGISVTEEKLIEAMENEDSRFSVADGQAAGRIGKGIVIPPDVLE